MIITRLAIRQIIKNLTVETSSCLIAESPLYLADDDPLIVCEDEELDVELIDEEVDKPLCIFTENEEKPCSGISGAFLVFY